MKHNMKTALLVLALGLMSTPALADSSTPETTATTTTTNEDNGMDWGWLGLLGLAGLAGLRRKEPAVVHTTTNTHR